MKIGINLDPFASKHGRYGELKFKKIREHGFEAVDYGIQNTDTYVYTSTEAEMREFLEREANSAKEAGVVISQIHGPWRYPPMDLTPEDLNERMDKMKRAVLATEAIGSKYMVIHPIMPFGTADIQDGKEKETFEMNISFMTELATYAGEHGVTVCIENMPMLGFSIARPAKILELVLAVGLDSFMICLDTGHVSVFDDLSPSEEILRLGKYLKVLHIHDNLGDKDAHLFPTLGRVNWGGVKESLDAIGFDGVFSLECAPSPLLSDVEFEKESKRLAEIARKIIN